MTKEWIICIIIIIAVVSLNIITQNYTSESVEQLNTSLWNLKEKLKLENPNGDEIKDDMDGIMEEWRNRFNLLAFFIEHDELEKAETELTSLKANIEVEEYNSAVPEIEKAAFILEHIKNKFRLEIKNVFQKNKSRRQVV